MTSLLAGGLTAGFLKSWGMILVSEIGDKTFFIAAVMAMKNSRQSVSTKLVRSFALAWRHGKLHQITTLATALKMACRYASPSILHCSGVWRCSWCSGSYDSFVSTDGMGRTNLGQSISAFPVLLIAAGISTPISYSLLYRILSCRSPSNTHSMEQHCSSLYLGSKCCMRLRRLWRRCLPPLHILLSST